ncbi:MAG: hypothetical protein WD046_00175 [Paracoccaceae bacterium]
MDLVKAWRAEAGAAGNLLAAGKAAGRVEDAAQRLGEMAEQGL